MAKFFRYALAAAMMLTTSSAFAAFKNFAIDLRSDLLEETEQVGGTQLSYGVVFNEDGTLTRVDANDATADMVLSGKFHSTDHGWTGTTLVVNVDGPVKVITGSCSFASGKVTGKNSAGETVLEYEGKKNGCYKNDPKEITEGIYRGGADKLTITYGSYLPYIAMEVVDPSTLVEERTVTYSLGDVVCEGDLLPATQKAEIGKTVVIPANHTLYVEGQTLTGWTDGSATYAPGDEYTITEENVTLTPVFTANTVSLADRKEAVTVNFDFQQKNGAPVLAYEGKDGIYVAQAVVNGETIDVVTRFSTNPGKIANANWQDWVQLNEGTTFAIPSCKGATVSIDAFSDVENTITIDGQNDYTTGTKIEYTVANEAETIDVVFGAKGSYFRYIKVVLPVVQTSAGGTTYTDEPTTIYWPLDDVTNYATSYTVTPGEDVFDIVTVNIAPDPTAVTQEAAKQMDGKSDGVNFLKIQPSSGKDDKINWSVTPATGLTFTPTKFSMHICRFGTDAQNGVSISLTNEAGQTVSFGPYTALRNGKVTSKDYDSLENATSYVEVELTPAQQEALAGSGALTLSATIGVGNAKQGGFGQVYLYGNINGTSQDVKKYTVDFAAAPEEGGSVSIYPVAAQYNEGSEVKLTAKENFGYDFINWTDAQGNVVSETAVFTHTVNADAVLTANFLKVETYELNYKVDGGANLYMVTPSPAPTVVDGKNMYEAGTNVSLVAASNPILTFTNWSDGQTSGEIIIPMNEDVEITANYSGVDYIAAWDFYLKGASGRPADFASDENASTQLTLRNDAGDVQGWLDKSQMAAGGYEGRPGAVNWRVGDSNGDVGNYYFQTLINAASFTDIKVQTSSVYNYNSYQKYDLQYSLDGENWTTVGSLNMGGAKSWTDLTVSLPAETNNQAELYLRWYPDRSSNIDGTSSTNDGFCLGATYITGTAKLINDGKAPVLVSTVPAEGFAEASANGKIVLTFDEKVKVAEGTKATLGELALTPSVAGKVVTFEYKGLSYTTDYTFVLPANSVMDLTDNAYAEAIKINFSTKAKPEVQKALYDFIVPDDGDFRQAIEAANGRADKSVRYRIFVKQGSHISPTKGTRPGVHNDGGPDFTGMTFDDPRLDLTANNVSIIGEGMEVTSVANIVPDAIGGTNPIEGLRNAYTLHNTASGTYIQDIKLINSLKDNTGRGEAYEESGDKTILKNVGLWGYQDTYCSNNGRGRYYFEGGVVRGRTDYICGKDDIFFNGVEFRNVGNGGYVAVPSNPKQYGWILRDCRLTAEDPSDTNGKYTLGRPWGKGTPIALWINTTCEVVPKAEGWNEMSGGWPARFAEYNTVDSKGNVIDLKGRKKIFADEHENNPILTAEEAAFYTIANVLGGEDDWDPTEATEQASAPRNVKIANTVITWDNSNYVLCWAVCENGKVVAFTTEPTFDIATLTTNAANATYSVRAANEMGGLSEATVATAGNPDSISEVGASVEVVSSVYYNLTGARVDADYVGVVIRVDTLSDGSTLTTKTVNK